LSLLSLLSLVLLLLSLLLMLMLLLSSLRLLLTLLKADRSRSTQVKTGTRAPTHQLQHWAPTAAPPLSRPESRKVACCALTSAMPISVHHLLAVAAQVETSAPHCQPQRAGPKRPHNPIAAEITWTPLLLLQLLSLLLLLLLFLVVRACVLGSCPCCYR
jgi:hypothetical protein